MPATKSIYVDIPADTKPTARKDIKLHVVEIEFMNL